jgi:hypothetical protein
MDHYLSPCLFICVMYLGLRGAKPLSEYTRERIWTGMRGNFDIHVC